MVDDRGKLDLTKQIDSLKEAIYQLKKKLDLTKETAQADLIEKDHEIGRLMKKITEKGI